MEHIQNMEYSLRAVQSLFRQIRTEVWSLPYIFYLCDYDFLNVHDYIVEAKKYNMQTQSDRELLKKTLREHLDIAKSIVYEKTEIEKTEPDKTRLYCHFIKSLPYYRHIHYIDKNNTSLSTFDETQENSDYYNYLKIVDLAGLEDEYAPFYDYSEVSGKNLLIKVCGIVEKLESLLGDEETNSTQPFVVATTITIPDGILNDLEAENLITKEPLQWVAAANLCAYFVDNYFTNHSNLWAIGEVLFKVKNLAQSKDNYLRYNEIGKPRKHQIIDNILLKNK
jgi:hypothetical protein